MKTLREIFRRKLRSSLTIFGISIGIFTLVVLGAFIEKAGGAMQYATGYYESRVPGGDAQDISMTGLPSGNRPLSMKKIDEVKRVRGVKDVAPQIYIILDPDQPVTGGAPNMILGGFTGTKKSPESWRVSKGRFFSETEKGVAVVGPDLVKQLNAVVGERIEVYGEKFKVVGVLDKTLTLLDQSVLLPMVDARNLYVDSLPQVIRKKVNAEDLAMGFVAYADTGQNVDELAQRINREVKGVKATGVTEMKSLMSGMIAAAAAVMLGVGLIALLIGGLTVINTMTMSVSERTPEIGIKRAMGASVGRILREILIEAGVISGIGGLLGIGAGMLAVVVINEITLSRLGVALFMFTVRLTAMALIFSISLGVLAGFYPAWRAARADPVKALAYE